MSSNLGSRSISSPPPQRLAGPSPRALPLARPAAGLAGLRPGACGARLRLDARDLRDLPLPRVGAEAEPALRAAWIALPLREPGRADAILRHSAVVALAERVEDLLRRDRRLVETDPDRVVDRVRDRGHDGVQRTFAGLLRAERPLRVDGLDDDRLEHGGIERRRDLVIQQRRLLVQPATEDLLLADDLAVSHVGGSFDLAFDVDRIEGAAAVVRGDDAIDGKHPGLEVHSHLRDRGLVRVRGRRADAGALVIAADPWRRAVRACRGKRAVPRPREVRRLD